jgi:hypothetical protein
MIIANIKIVMESNNSAIQGGENQPLTEMTSMKVGADNVYSPYGKKDSVGARKCAGRSRTAERSQAHAGAMRKKEKNSE